VSKLPKVSIILFFCILTLLTISACTPEEPQAVATVVVRPTLTTSSLPATTEPTSLETPQPLPTAQLLPTDTAVPTSTATSTPLPLSACSFYPEKNETPPTNDAIYFVSQAIRPVPNGPGSYGGNGLPQLWAISPAEQTMTRITMDEQGIAWYYQTGDNPFLNIFVGTPLNLATEQVHQLELPAACIAPTPQADQDFGYAICEEYQISPTGQWVSFKAGFEACSLPGLGLFNVGTGEMNLDSFPTEVFNHTFLPDGRLLVVQRHCEGDGEIFLLDPQTRSVTSLGRGNGWLWNSNRTAFITQSDEFLGYQSQVWAYNLAQDRLIFSTQDAAGRIFWTPDDRYFLYEHRVHVYASGQITATFSPRQIYIVDVTTGEERPLLDDPQHNYHFCSPSYSCGQSWQGDWVSVSRTPYLSAEFPWSSDGSHAPDWNDPAIRCLQYGRACAEPAESLGLNWRTGELLPWSQIPVFMPTIAATPTVTPSPIPASPNLAIAPLYTHPEEAYALYIATNGNSLWCVPAEGTPIPWVTNGHSFTYEP
jgi:hypothetical protein